MGFETKLSLSPLGQMVLLDLLIPRVLSVTCCAASACRVSYDIPVIHPASCTMDDLIKLGKKKIKDLDANAVSEDINSKFNVLHMSHFAYACKTEGKNGISHFISALCINCLISIPEYSRLNHLDVHLV